MSQQHLCPVGAELGALCIMVTQDTGIRHTTNLNRIIAYFRKYEFVVFVYQSPLRVCLHCAVIINGSHIAFSYCANLLKRECMSCGRQWQWLCYESVHLEQSSIWDRKNKNNVRKWCQWTKIVAVYLFSLQLHETCHATGFQKSTISRLASLAVTRHQTNNSQFHILYIGLIRSRHFYIRVNCLELQGPSQWLCVYSVEFQLTMCSKTGRTFWQSCITRVIYSTYIQRDLW